MGEEKTKPEKAKPEQAKPEQAKPKKSPREMIAALPEIWELLRPRRRLLTAGFVLMAVNRVSGLVLPASTKFL
ncbi:MAG: ABC transporter ATP-binding protein, partial [Acidobacteria bacterium]|nr:ABC transporter ATP-binding protein [Acidobacteriota bacterium]